MSISRFLCAMSITDSAADVKILTHHLIIGLKFSYGFGYDFWLYSNATSNNHAFFD